MLAKMDRPSRTAVMIVAKLSSARIMSAASFVTSVPADAHGDADVGRLERRGVVHAVAGHGDDVAVSLEGVDDPQLVLGRDPGVHRDVARRGPQLIIVETLDVGAGERASSRVGRCRGRWRCALRCGGGRR